jgi:hypothetical protein
LSGRLHNANPSVRRELLANPLNPDGGGVSNALYRNVGVDANGLPRFVDVTEEAGLFDSFGIGYGAVAADFDNDGDQDTFISPMV